jgi:ATP-dependent helicase HrpB
VFPLHGELRAEEQDAALGPCDRRKVILATNVAETSLTVPGATTVIDSGLAKISAFDADTGLDRLEMRRISKASATQRAGRAGRLGPGRAFRFVDEKRRSGDAALRSPEIRRVDIAPVALSLHAFGEHDRRFPLVRISGCAGTEAAESVLSSSGPSIPRSVG